MRVLIVNTTIDMTKFGKYANLLEAMPCIGIASMGAVLREHGHEVGLIDDFADQIGPEQIAFAAYQGGYDVVGMNVLTPCVPNVLEACKLIKELNPNIKIVLGNVHASLFWEEILETWPADVICMNEGEYVLLEIVKAYEKDGYLGDIPGIAFKHDGKPVQTANRALLTSEQLDGLPYPAWDLLPIEKYGLLPFATIEKPILTMYFSRGCPYKCHFCSLMHLDSNYRYRDPVAVVDEFEFLVEHYGVKQVGFVDPIFALRKRDTIKFCEEMERRGLPDKACWIMETRQDIMNYDLMKRMADAGLRRVMFGMESGSENILKKINKKFTPEHGNKAVDAARRAGVETVGLFIIGMPGESMEEIEQTINYAVECGVDFAKFAIAIPYPGSEWYEQVARQGFARKDWENFTTFNPDPEQLVMMTNKLGPEELLAAQRHATRKFYLRPWQVYNHVFKIKSLSTYGFYEAFKVLFTH